MWGSSAVASILIPLSGAGQGQTVQLARVNYRRPESWNFIFAAELISTPQVQDTSIILVDFDVIVGVGRSVVTLGRSDEPPTEVGTSENTRGYARLRWQTANPRFNEQKKWTTVGTLPVPDDMEPTVGGRVSSYFVAQDIQCKARIHITGTTAFTYAVNVSAFFAPRAHVRPDWYAKLAEEQFRGEEFGGT